MSAALIAEIALGTFIGLRPRRLAHQTSCGVTMRDLCEYLALTAFLAMIACVAIYCGA